MRIPTTKGALTPTTLRGGGMLAMASAVLTLPMFLYSLQLEGRHDESARTMQLLLQVSGTFIFVALIATLRGFLGRNCAFGKAGAIIAAMIILNLVYAAASSVLIFNPGMGERLQPVLAALVILLGIAQAGLGMRLFALDNDLGGMKRPYCWLNIVTGVCLASLLLIPLGIVTSAVGDVMLGTIFFREARRLSSHPETGEH